MLQIEGAEVCRWSLPWLLFSSSWIGKMNYWTSADALVDFPCRWKCHCGWPCGLELHVHVISAWISWGWGACSAVGSLKFWANWDWRGRGLGHFIVSSFICKKYFYFFLRIMKFTDYSTCHRVFDLLGVERMPHRATYLPTPFGASVHLAAVIL